MYVVHTSISCVKFEHKADSLSDARTVVNSLTYRGFTAYITDANGEVVK